VKQVPLATLENQLGKGKGQPAISHKQRAINNQPQAIGGRQLAISTLHLDSHSPPSEVRLNRFLSSAYPATRTANASWSKVARTLTNSAQCLKDCRKLPQ